MALEGVKSEKSEESNGTVVDGKANGIDNKSKQVRISAWLFYFRLGLSISLTRNTINGTLDCSATFFKYLLSAFHCKI